MLSFIHNVLHASIWCLWCSLFVLHRWLSSTVPVTCGSTSTPRASKRNDARQNKTALRPRAEKLRILGPIKPLINFHKCFISCAAECPDNISKNSWTYPKEWNKNQNKTSMTKAIEPFRDSQTPFWLLQAPDRCTGWTPLRLVLITWDRLDCICLFFVCFLFCVELITTYKRQSMFNIYSFYMCLF